MKTMIMNTLGLLMVAFVMFLIFKKIKSIIPTLLGGALSKDHIPTAPEYENSGLNMSNIIELDEEDIDIDDLDSDDELVLSKSTGDNESGDDVEDNSEDDVEDNSEDDVEDNSEDDVEDNSEDNSEDDVEDGDVEEPVVVEPVVEEPVVEEPVVEEPVVEEPVRKRRGSKNTKAKKGNTIKI